MAEIRKDSIVERWVVFAPERANRPMEPRVHEVTLSGEKDPFAEGNVAMTPGEILAYRDVGSTPDGPGWRVRVVPNKYPALTLDGQSRLDDEQFHVSIGGVGVHEVIVDCPRDETNLSRLSVENVREVFCAYRDRLIDLKRDPRLAHATIFKNQGSLAGASQRHAHSQLIATPIVPMVIRDELSASFKYYEKYGQSIFAELVEREIAAQLRMVIESSRFVAFCAYAGRFPAETWIVPRRCESHFEKIQADELADLARVLKQLLESYERAFDDPPYNYVLHTAPFGESTLPYYSWHIEVLPRVTNIAGFEWGSGMFINPIFPEDAANRLRLL